MLWMDGETHGPSGDNPPAAGLPAPGPVEAVDNMVGTREAGDRRQRAAVHNPQALLLRRLKISDLSGTATMLPRRPR